MIAKTRAEGIKLVTYVFKIPFYEEDLLCLCGSILFFGSTLVLKVFETIWEQRIVVDLRDVKGRKRQKYMA